MNKGEVDYVIGIGIDVTERRKAEQEVTAHLETKGADSSLCMVKEFMELMSMEKRIFFNRRAEKLTGWAWQEIQGRVLHSLLHHTKSDGTPYSVGGLSSLLIFNARECS